MDETNKQQKLPDEDKVVFVPVEEIRVIEGILDKMEQAQQEFRKVAEGMVSADNGELKVEKK